jgi:hypothetical protein
VLTLKFFKRLFLVAGLWNTGAGIIAMVFYKFVFETAFLHPITPADHLLVIDHMVLFFTVAVIGLALLFASRDPGNNRALIFACALGKIVPPIVWAMLYFSGEGSALLFGGICGDFAFSFFFIAYLVKTKKIEHR